MQQLSLARLIQWGDHLAVGHQEIDAQHKAIMELGMRLYEGWRGGSGVKTLRPLVAKLGKLFPAHLAYEERVLAEIGFEDLDQHAAEHRKMSADFAVLEDRFAGVKDDEVSASGSLMAPGWPIMQFFLEFTLGHVGTSDMSYCRALAASKG